MVGRFNLLLLMMVSFGISRFGLSEPKTSKSSSSFNEFQSSNSNNQQKTKSSGIQGIEDPRKRKYRRRLASEKLGRKADWFLGINSSFDGPLAKVESGEKLSRGLGLSGGLSVQYQFPGMRILFQPSYRYLRVSRDIDGTGINQDTSISQFTQKVNFLGLATSLSFLMERGGGVENPWEPAWWTEIGTEVLLPLSGTQTSSVSEDLKIKADKLWFLLLGGALDFELAPNRVLRTGLHLFYNLPGNSKGRLFGVRAQIAFDFGLL